MQVYMTKSQLQSLIARNKQQIIKLEAYRSYYKELINYYWERSVPFSLDPSSKVAFESLNEAKGYLRKTKKELKKLVELQYNLKRSMENY